MTQFIFFRACKNNFGLDTIFYFSLFIFLYSMQTSPFHAHDRKDDKRETISSSLENLNIVNEAHTTSIIGGCVVKTPVSTVIVRFYIFQRNNAHFSTKI